MYNKIFHKILDSSIWLEPTPTRIVWITLLAAMDQDGFAHFSAVENLASRARVTLDEAKEAVECFLEPDPNSANPANEGRRIERIPGGYVVLNADEHRKTISREIQREQTRERVARFRAKTQCNKTSYKKVTRPLPGATSVYVSASVSELLPKGLSQKTWDEFKKSRVAIKAKMTPFAESRILKRLWRMVEDGENPEEVVGRSIENGWKGLFPVKKDNGARAPSKTAQALQALEGKRR